MTARWSGVFLDDGGNAIAGADLEVERRRACSACSPRIGKGSPEVMFQAGARDAKRRL